MFLEITGPLLQFTLRKLSSYILVLRVFHTLRPHFPWSNREERRLNRHYESINRMTKRDVANTITEKTHFKKKSLFVRNTVSCCKKATKSATNTSNHYRNESNITSDAINDRTRLFDTFITPVFLPSFYRSTFTTEFFYLLHF